MGRLDNIQFRRGTAAEWTAADPILHEGEPGFETDTDKMKVGDGTTVWSLLPYISGAGAGPAGADGSPGVPGFPGPEGSEGTTFVIPGPRGLTGPEGPAGPAGADGDGKAAAPGMPGEDGPPGMFVPGARGATGATGSQGPQGDPGAQGAQGNPGADGADGARGPLGFPGSDGEDGFFVPGIRGLTGATGSQGPQGDPGTPGAPGADGADGARGPIGFTGPEGESTIFVPGPRGATGATGSQGPQGDPGSAGADGTPGVPGMPGADGEGSDFMAVPPRRIKASELLHNSLSGRAVSDAHDAAYISFPVGWYPNGGILGSAAQDVRTAFDELDTHSHDGVLQSGYYPDGQPVQYRNLGRKPQMWVPPAASDGEPGLFLPGPRGPQGPTGATGPQGDPGTSGSGGPAGPPAMYVEDGDPGMFVPGQKLTRWDSNWVELISTGDETVTNSSTLVSHTQLVVPLASEALYEVEFSIIISANNNIGDIKIAWTLANALDAGSDIFGEIWGELGTNAAGTISEYIGASTTIWPSSGGHAIGADSLSQNTPRLFWGRFMVFNNANAGATTASLQFANATPAGGRTSTIRAGSLVRYRRRA